MPAGHQGRNALPAGWPLTEYHIVLYGAFSRPHKELKSLFTFLGASVTDRISQHTSHLVCEKRNFDTNAPQVRVARSLKKGPVKVLVKPAWVETIVNFKDDPKISTLPNPDDYLWETLDKHGNAKAEPAASSNAKTISSCKKSKFRIASPNEGERSYERSSITHGHGNGISGHEPVHDSVHDAVDEQLTKTNISEVPDEPFTVEVTEEQVLGKKPIDPSHCQVLSKGHIVVPVDDHRLLQDYAVYIDPRSGTAYDASLNRCNASNNNEFYRLQVLFKDNNYKTWTRWGRVGLKGRGAILGTGSLDDAKQRFGKKFKDKSGLAWEDRTGRPQPEKYVFVEHSYGPAEAADSDSDGNDGSNSVDEDTNIAAEQKDRDPPECTIPIEVQRVMTLIFNQDYFNTTIQATIVRGLQQLKDLAALMNDPTLAFNQWNMTYTAATERLSNMYYSLVPHVFGRNFPPIINSEHHLQKEVELLQSLSDLKSASDIMNIDRLDLVHPLDSYFNSLGLDEMSPLNHSSKEYDFLKKCLNYSKGTSHHISYEVYNIFRIRRKGEQQRFKAFKLGKVISNKRLLWHGSRCTNFGGILSQGLRIAPPEAPVSGYMFGKGIYLAHMSSKSAYYCCPETSNPEALLLLCEVELGDPLEAVRHASYHAGEKAKENGRCSTWGLGKTGPAQWVDAGKIHDSLQVSEWFVP
ncbi:poly polymerase 2 ADP-ribosyltransferase 2, partial [Metarhizium hybridum]